MRGELKVWHFNLALAKRKQIDSSLASKKRGQAPFFPGPFFPVEDAAKRLDGLQKLP
jgi:hypothetical protein